MKGRESYIRLEGLSKAFEEGGHSRTVLQGADAEFDRGEFVAILGKSGSGKSTLLNLISGIDLVDHGDIWMNDQNAVKLATATARSMATARRRKWGIFT